MRAVVGDIVIGEAPEEDLISIEGNWYFPPASVNQEPLEQSPTPYPTIYGVISSAIPRYCAVDTPGPVS